MVMFVPVPKVGAFPVMIHPVASYWVSNRVSTELTRLESRDPYSES